MLRHTPHDHATSNVLAWSHHAANVESAADDEASADVDEPPDWHMPRPQMTPDFRRTSVPNKPKETHASLLTRALQSADEDDVTASTLSRRDTSWRRRRSITSDISVTSTAGLTSDTGLSTPARTNSPSPRLLDIGFVPRVIEKHGGAPVQIAGSFPRRDLAAYSMRKPQAHTKPVVAEQTKDPAVQQIEKKRCISFACTAKPKGDAAKAPAPAPEPAVVPLQTKTPAPSQPAQTRRPCIKFACPARQQTPPNRERLLIPQTEESGSVSTVVSTPATVRKSRSPVARRVRPMTPRIIPLSPAPPQRKKKYLTASSDELQGEEYHFHAFASDHLPQDDWILEESSVRKSKLLIDDLLKKENDFRRIAKEAEDEAEQEEAEDDDDGEENAEEDDDEEAMVEEDDELEENVDDDQSGYGSDDDFSDGYNTDEDLGFADSDDDEDDDLCLWTLTASQSYMAKFSDATPVLRRASFGAMSDSSVCSRKVNVVRTKRSRQQSIIARPVTPELPDSTDFVCGTMDEDRPLEEAYATRLAARKLEKLRAIPQDIDPSFPTSDREDEDDDDMHHSHDSGEPLWLHGELEELHDERTGRRQRKSDVSPKRHRSPPPPKRYHSPPPKARGRSPRRLIDYSSPKRTKPPAPVAHLQSPMGSPTHPGPGHALAFKSLAARPGLTHTKSLPRATYFPAHIKSGKRGKAGKDTAHVRGAIDIVKGLEQKRQRRKEKFHQKYCDRARKGQVPEKKKARIGEGAERMRELGLLSAEKRNYVISV